MSTTEELKVLLASFERLAAFTNDEGRRRRLLEVMANIRSLLSEQEKPGEIAARETGSDD